MAGNAPVHELSREVLRELVVATEQGKSRSFAGLREEVGLGAGDLRDILDQLREEGLASESAPGEWEALLSDEVAREARPAPAEPVRVKVEDVADVPPAPQRYPVAVESVRLTRAMVDALADDALGKLVRAGVAGSEGLFALEVD